MREWQVKRRERTRQLIELGGLVAKANLVELTGDDRAVMLGMLVEAAATLRGDRRETQLQLWRRRGQRAFAHEPNARPSEPFSTIDIYPSSKEFGS